MESGHDFQVLGRKMDGAVSAWRGVVWYVREILAARVYKQDDFSEPTQDTSYLQYSYTM
jgi:hypothetical protein